MDVNNDAGLAQAEHRLQRVIEELDKRSRHLNLVGLGLSVMSVAAATAFCIFLFLTTQKLLVDLNQAASPVVTLLFLIVRSSAIGGVAITVLISMMRISNACFDQSARFAKRRYGAFFLMFLYETYSNPQTHEQVTVPNIMKFFESWNETVESAFSHVKVTKKESEPLKLSADKDGVKFEVGQQK